VQSNDSPKLYTYLKKVSFPNGTSLVVNINSGNIKNGEFMSYPTLSIYSVKNGLGHSEFLMVHHFTMGSALGYGGRELTDSFKKELTRLYDLIIERAYLRSPK
jgi:hypothetical protein